MWRPYSAAIWKGELMLMGGDNGACTLQSCL